MIDHDEICRLIPHEGSMCLLGEVRFWDENKIICASMTHIDTRNPLRNENELPMLSLIEYGAQAMAVHGCLSAKCRPMQTGYLAALRDVKIEPGDLADIDSELIIEAERIFADAGNMIYSVLVHSRTKNLMSARATVMARFKDS